MSTICQFLFVSREKEYERLGGWQGVCGRAARHLCSHHVRVWQCRAVGKSKYTQNTNFKIQKNTNKIKTKHKLQRNTNTCVLIMFGSGSVTQSVGCTNFKEKRNKLCLQVMVNWVELTRCWVRRPMATCFLSISAGNVLISSSKQNFWLILIYLKLKQSNSSFNTQGLWSSDRSAGGRPCVWSSPQPCS